MDKKQQVGGNMKYKIVAIVGPSTTKKTIISYLLAEKLNKVAVINGDQMQTQKRFNIELGTIDSDKFENVDKYFYRLNRSKIVSVSKYVQMFRKLIKTSTYNYYIIEGLSVDYANKLVEYYDIIFIGLYLVEEEWKTEIDKRIYTSFLNLKLKDFIKILTNSLFRAKSMDNSIGSYSIKNFFKNKETLGEVKNKIIENTVNIHRDKIAMYSNYENIKWFDSSNTYETVAKIIKIIGK